MELNKYKNIYFIGIGGSGMSALANYFVLENKNVSGYDKSKSVNTNNLESKGVEIIYNDRLMDLDKVYMDKNNTLVIYTPAIPRSLKILDYFISNDFVVIKRSEALGLIANSSFCVAIAGTHGKTTTTSILGHLLKYCNKSATTFLGGISENYNSNLIANGKDICVVEADEFDKSFLTLKPNIACITSIDADHLDIYNNIDDLKDTFNLFINQIVPNGHLIVSDQLSLKGDKYGFNKNSKFNIQNIVLSNGSYSFDLCVDGELYPNFNFNYPGKHNLSNALAALIIAFKLNCKIEDLKPALLSFKGVQRRYSFHINSKDLVYIDDYAHHPEEISAIYDSLVESYPKKIILLPFNHIYIQEQEILLKNLLRYYQSFIPYLF
jgi:UDP-N-acetylmuramate--alanine ligase